MENGNGIEHPLDSEHHVGAETACCAPAHRAFDLVIGVANNAPTLLFQLFVIFELGISKSLNHPYFFGGKTLRKAIPVLSGYDNDEVYFIQPRTSPVCPLH